VKGGAEKLCVGQLLAEKPEKGKALRRREVSGDWKVGAEAQVRVFQFRCCRVRVRLLLHG